MQELEKQKLNHPFSGFLLITLPQGIFILSLITAYMDIKSYIDSEAMQLAVVLVIIQGVLLIAGVLVQLIYLKKKKPLEYPYYFAVILISLAYFYTFCYLIAGSGINPPRWAFNSLQGFFQLIGCYVVIVLYSVLGSLGSLLAKENNKVAWKNFLFALLIPLGYYIVYRVIIPALKWYSLPDFMLHVAIISVILGTVAFFFLIFRGIFIIFLKKKEKLTRWMPLTKIIFCLVLPLGGLFLYNFGENLTGGGFEQLLGDLGHLFYFLLAGAAGIVLILPTFKNLTMRRALFLIKIVLYPFSIFFFFLFLPIIPISVILITVGGLGLVLISPIFLFFFHTKSLVEDWKALEVNRAGVAVCFLVLVLPLALILNYNNDKKNLDKVLDYVFTPDYKNMPDINIDEFRGTLKNINNRRNGIQTPILSPLYNKIVFNNLDLGEDKESLMDKIFFNQGYYRSSVQKSPPGNQNPNVQITDLTTQSSYDKIRGLWTSKVDMEITNISDFQDEFRVNFMLPPGSFITDYYLVIDGKKEPGIMADKKAALWIYNRIVSRRRDPGFLHYNADGSLSLKVFPCMPDEIRDTGLEIIHKTPIEVNLGDRTIILGEQSQQKDVITKQGNKLFLSGSALSKLEPVKRQKEYHIVLDCSETRWENHQKYIETIERFLLTTDKREVFIHLSNFDTVTFPSSGKWKEALKREDTYRGTLFWDHIAGRVLMEEAEKKDNTYAEIILIAPDLKNVIQYRNLSTLEWVIPERNGFFHLNLEEKLFFCEWDSALNYEEMEPVDGLPPGQDVRVWPSSAKPEAYITYSPQGALIPLLNEDMENTGSNKWEKAFCLWRNWQETELYPFRYNLLFRPTVVGSIEERILTPFTALISLENESQKRALLKKQEATIKGHKGLGETEEIVAAPMSEPGLWMFLMVFIFFIRKKKQ